MADTAETKKRAILSIAKAIIGTKEDRIAAAKELAQLEGIELTDDDLKQL